ncbi:MAG: hypothetical protein IKP20_04510 [Candidatus Methanomethylophilaceae archaeon]|nr:hypothetical protein [Candidatus Methanomethylophilaceae archaeon]
MGKGEHEYQWEEGLTRYERRKERIDLANLAISSASLGLAALALSLNAKGEDTMANRIDPSKYSTRKDLKKAYRAEIKRASVSEVGYTGPVIVLNEGGRKVRYGIVPLKPGTKKGKANPKPRAKARAPSKRASAKREASMDWVALEMGPNNSRQAIVCASREAASAKARSMKRSRASSRGYVHGYARVDTSKRVDVEGILKGRRGAVYGVRRWPPRGSRPRRRSIRRDGTRSPTTATPKMPTSP